MPDSKQEQTSAPYAELNPRHRAIIFALIELSTGFARRRGRTEPDIDDLFTASVHLIDDVMTNPTDTIAMSLRACMDDEEKRNPINDRLVEMMRARETPNA